MPYWRDDRRKVVEVFEGLGGGIFLSGERTRSGGHHRVVTPALRVRTQREAAQRDLDTYAKKHGWLYINEFEAQARIEGHG